jgi:NAD(P)-dependent dehydrogenase (short-subunit alcohol dehydrogenase family)
MGRAAAIAFAREGADVAINHLPEEMEDAREVVELMKAEGRKALSIPGDIRDESFCKRLVAEAVQGLGGLDILVSNAGRQQTRASILDLSTEYFDATMKTNIYAPFWIIKSALPHMPPGSAIIGTASEQAYDPSLTSTTMLRQRPLFHEPQNDFGKGFTRLAQSRQSDDLHLRKRRAAEAMVRLGGEHR